MKTIRKLAAPVLPFAGEFSPEQLPQVWQNLEEWEIACYPWSAPDGYRPTRDRDYRVELVSPKLTYGELPKFQE